MTLQAMRWEVAAPLGEQDLARFPNLSPLMVQLLFNRGIREVAAAEAFLSGSASGHSPFRLKGMDDAVTRVRRAIRAGERIAVYGDFDADGVTATALLAQVLTAAGADAEPYIPDRVDEGYGLNLDALRRLYRKGVRLVVTVDCGIRSVWEAEQASQGLDLIITDHHSVGKRLPTSVATINPKQPDCPYPFKELAGVGVAFKLAQALLLVQKQTRRAAPLTEEALLDLVALGTVADLASLMGENRGLVRRGLELLNEPARPGVEALMADASLRRGGVDATAIGFRLGPRLNAAGRLDSPMLAYRLLTSHDIIETRDLAGKLGEINRRRQDLTEQTVAAAEAQVLADHPEARLYMASSADFMPGIVGLAASRLAEAHYRPSIVVELGEEQSRGSCRSIPEFHITDALEECSDLLIRFGGHRAAAGFTVATRNLDALRRRLQTIAGEQLEGVELRASLAIDAAVPLDEVGWDTRRMLAQMEPCGVDNPQPVLVSRGLQVRGARAVGSDGKHLKLALRDGRDVAWDAIAFRRGDLLQKLPSHVDVAYTLETSTWNGEERLQLNVQDLRAAATG